MASRLKKFSAVLLSAVMISACPAFAAEKATAKKSAKTASGEDGEFDIFDVKTTDLSDKNGKKDLDSEFPMPDFNEHIPAPDNKFTKDLFDENVAPVKPSAPVQAVPAKTAVEEKTVTPEAQKTEPVVEPEVKSPQEMAPAPAVEMPVPSVPAAPEIAAPVPAAPQNAEIPSGTNLPASPVTDSLPAPEAVQKNDMAQPVPVAAMPAEVSNQDTPAKLENVVPEPPLSIQDVNTYSNLKQHLYNFLKSFSNGHSVAANDVNGGPLTPSSVGDYKTISPDDYANMNNMIPPESAVQPAPVLQPDNGAGYTPEQIKAYIGTCAGLDIKIKTCLAFECVMPKISNSDINLNIKISPVEGGCAITAMVTNEAAVECKFDAMAVEQLSQRFGQYFQSGSPAIDLQKEYPASCPVSGANTQVPAALVAPASPVAAPAIPGVPENPVPPVAAANPVDTTAVPQPVAIADAKEGKKTVTKSAPEEKKATENKISDADRAYMEMMDKKADALPKNKQLSDSTTDTLKTVTPSLITPKKDKQGNQETEYISVTHGKDISTIKEVDGEAASESGIKLSSRNPKTAKESVVIKKKMDEAYRALLAGQLGASATLYKEILAKDPENNDALFGLAAAYHKNSQFDEARDIYTKILKKEPNNKEILNNFLVIVAEEAPEDALIELQKLERINSDFSPIPAQIAMIHLKMNEPKKAERYLRRAVLLSPENITYKYNLAITEDRLQDYPQAVRLYRQIIEAVENGAVIPGSITAIQERLSFLEQKVKLD